MSSADSCPGLQLPGHGHNIQAWDQACCDKATILDLAGVLWPDFRGAVTEACVWQGALGIHPGRNLNVLWGWLDTGRGQEKRLLLIFFTNNFGSRK